ncbi:transient receptor potential cation channel subfamily M member-like 2 isoform X2 [Glandiceps talaboti]
MSYTRGEIRFTTNSETQARSAKFILVSDEDDYKAAARSVLGIMLVEWGYTKPQLMISVVGGSKRFNVKENQENVFISGIRKLTKTTGTTWFMTSGSNVGAVKLVGQAMQRISIKVRDKVSCIGIAAWTGINGKETIIKRPRKVKPSIFLTDGSKNSVRKKEDLSLDVYEHFYSGGYKPSQSSKQDGAVPLNPYHTHFIFVKKDDPDEEEYFRVKLWAEIQKLLTSGDLGPNDRPTSVVLIQIEGGIDTTRTVRNSLKKNIPVVVCKGTGRASDYLSYACKHCDHLNDLLERYPGYFHQMIDTAHPGVSAKEHRSLLDQLLGYIEDIMAMRNLVEVFKMNEEREEAGFDFAVLKALLRARGGSKEYLRLAFDWNRCDIAKEMFKQSNINLRDSDTQALMTRALLERENRVGFIALLLEKGLVIEEYLTVNRLEHLYQSHASKSLIPALRVKDLNISYKKDILPLIKTLMQSYFKPPEVNGETFEKPYQELLIWAILVNKTEVTEYMWENASSPLSLGLAATRLYRAIGPLAVDPSDMDECYELADLFEKRVGMYLNSLNSLDENVTRTILETPCETWGNLSPVDLSNVSMTKNFMSTSTCQEILEERWNGKMVHPSHWTVFFVAIFPFLLCSRVIPNFKTEMKFIKRVVAFYTAPVTKFIVNWIALVAFLVFFSHMTLYYEVDVGIADILLHVWMVTMFLDEIRQMFIPRNKYESVKQRFKHWIWSLWNWMDLLALLLILVAFLLRFNTLDLNWTYDLSRNLYAIACATFWIGMLRMYQSSPKLGPFLIMIKEMIWALFGFLMVLVVFIVAFGIASVAILSPGRSPSVLALRDIFYIPYYQVTVGDWALFSEYIESDSDSVLPSTLDTYVYSVLLAVYILIGNVLLLNLLIAIFSSVYTQVEANAMKEWKFHRYSLITEFEDIPALPAPLVVLTHIYRFFVWMGNQLRNTRNSQVKNSERNNNQQTYLTEYEQEAMDDYQQSIMKQRENSSEEQLKNLGKRLQSLHDKIKDMEEEQKVLVKKRDKQTS